MMNTANPYNRRVGHGLAHAALGRLAMGAALTCGLLLSSCSDDWDDHYATATHGDGSLWQTIAADGELSNFKAVLEAAGYDVSLGSSQVFTVFAPTDALLTASMRDSLIAAFRAQKQGGVATARNTVVKEFIQNHIALYNYSVAAGTHDSIVMMNGKYQVLGHDGLSGMPFARSNVQAGNGVLFTLRGVASYQPNIYEYIGRDADLDSLASFVYQYSEDYFVASQSAPGEIIDGVTHYLDSVTVLYNMLFNQVAEINDEDSTYWMLAPTNGVWRSLLERNIEMYQYDASVAIRDSLMYLYPRLGILRGTVFSRTVNPDASFADSAVSTNARTFAMRRLLYGNSDSRHYLYDRPFDEGGIFYGTSPVDCSNGRVVKTDSWVIPRSKTFLSDIVMEGESRASLDSVESSTTRDLAYVPVVSGNPYYDLVSRNYYVEIAPSASANPSAVFNVTDVLSNVAYDLYAVAVPAVAGDTLAPASQRVPTKFRCTVYYHDPTGKEASFRVSDTFTTDPSRIDSVLVGTYTFPTCSYGLDRAQVKVRIDGRVSNSEVNRGTGTKTLRLDCLVLRPHVDE